MLTDFLKTEQDIIWLYFAEEATGDMLGINVDPEARYVVTRVDSKNDLMSQGFELQPDDTLKPVDLLPQNPGRYDSRDRPWYHKAAEYSNEGNTVWTSPYSFLDSDAMGITATRAVRSNDGGLVGVLAADLELRRVGAFLDSFTVADGGGALLLLEDGTSVVPDRKRRNPHITTIHDALSRSDLDLGDLRPGTSLQKRFRHSDGSRYIGLFQGLDLPGKIRYFSGIVVPENSYLVTVRRNAILTAITGLVILAAAIFLGVREARRVTRPLSLLGEELEEIGNLKFRESGLDVRSSVREISLISDAVGKMKVSLLAFSRYVPRDLVRLLLARGEEAKPGGSLQKVTAVFSDLAGFTRLAEDLSPDEAFEELSEFLEIVATTQEARGGITRSFTGDGTLALFNAPSELENHGTQACLSALEILEKIETINQRRKAEGKFGFRARIGINTAEVLLGNLGTRDRFAYTAIGDGVNLASRLEGLGKQYGIAILVGSESVHEVGEVLEWRRFDRIAVLGRKQATDIFEPLGKSGEVDKTLLEFRDAYERALNLYFDGDFENALIGFRSAKEIAPKRSDPPSQLMIARIEGFLQNPSKVSQPWRGVIYADFK